MKDLENICLSVDHHLSEDYLPISPQIVQTSSFQFKNYQHYIDVNTHHLPAYTYTRGENPTLATFERKIAQLEHGENAICFASGMGAISATILSLVQKDEHILIVNTIYGSAQKFICELEKFGIQHTVITTTNTADIEAYIKPNTKLIYFESPSSQRFELLDLELISHIAKKHHIYTIIDNTWATPLLQNPLLHGIDVVIHSCSKYIGGHSDIVGGIVIANHAIIKKIRYFGVTFLGATMSPMNAWLAIRGLRTLPVRIKSLDTSIRQVIHFLQSDKRIEKIYHPLCADETQKELANKYLSGMGSLFSFVLKDANPEIIQKFVDTLQYFTLAYSWGGFESLVLPAFKGNNIEELKQRHLSIGHIRMYVGLEEPELLIQDISNALDQAYQNKKK